jgi:hypothetical protein
MALPGAPRPPLAARTASANVGFVHFDVARQQTAKVFGLLVSLR